MADFVLIHGSYQGGWIWKEVAGRLRGSGHNVYAPSLDGCGERQGAARPGITTETHADEVARLLFYEDLHDVVLVGTSSGGIVSGPTREDAENRLFADLDPKTRAWALERYTMHPAGIYEIPVKLDRFWELPWQAKVIWCRRAQNPGEAHQRRTAERLKASWDELDTGHYPMLSMPAELTALIAAG